MCVSLVEIIVALVYINVIAQQEASHQPEEQRYGDGSDPMLSRRRSMSLWSILRSGFDSGKMTAK